MTLTTSAMVSFGPCLPDKRTVRETCLDGNSVWAFVGEPVSRSFQLTHQAIDC